MSGSKNQPKGGGGRNQGSGPPRGRGAHRAARRIEVAGVDNPEAAPGEMARLQKRYREEVRAKLQAEFGYKNVMEVPRLEKIVINMGVGEATADQKKLDSAVAELT